jgi:RecB family exonuclease
MRSRQTVWISYSALSDFEKCKRAYYYKHLYRNPKNNNRIQVVSPYLSLGTVVHETIEALASFSPKKRKEISLFQRYEEIWENYKGKKGGFISEDQEKKFKERGEEMLKRAENSNLIKNQALDTNNVFPKLSLFENIELVGSIDWIEILPSGELHIVDFKTGKNDESNNSLQLPIYVLLARNNFDKNAKKASYFYLDRDESPVFQEMGPLNFYLEEIKEKSQRILSAIKNNDFACSSGYKNCFHCREFDAVFSGAAEYVGFDDKMRKELYYIIKQENVMERISGGTFLNEFQRGIFEMRIDGKETKEISLALKSSPSIIEDEVVKIKERLKENLSNKELKAFIRKMGG